MADAGKSQAEVQREFQQAGFEVKQGGGTAFEAKKNGFTLRIERNPAGLWLPVPPPRFEVRGVECELEDRGCQKFWYAGGKRFPAHLQELKALHKFDQEVRYLLGLKSLYHESLGSTSARTVYDRVDGRQDNLP